jgi:2-iminobutanoate/2-iminopropanoate deaminase
MFEAILSPDAPAPIGPYSQAVKCGEWVFLSGQIPLDPASGQVVGTTTSDQTQQVLANLQAVLLAAGLEPRHVVRTTIYLADLADFGTVNELYAAFFATAPVPPARSTVQVAALPRGVRIEIDAIAVGP